MLRLLRLPEVMHMTGLSRSSIYAYIQQGYFPASIPIGTRAVAWNSEAIEKWIAEKIRQAKKS